MRKRYSKLFEAAALLLLLPVFSFAAEQEETLREAQDSQFESGETNTSVNESGMGNPEKSANPIFDKLWSHAVIYRDYDKLLLQELSFFGRYHGQYYLLDSQQGSASGWNNRRFRLGMRVVFLQDWTFGVNFNLNTDDGDSLSSRLDKNSMETLTLAWSPESKNFQLVLGQQSIDFSYEFATSSNRILTVERSLLVNQLAPDNAPGFKVEGKHKVWQYELGLYSGNEIGEGIGRPLGFLKVGYDYSKVSRWEKAGVQLHYLYHSDANREKSDFYNHSLSMSIDFQEGPYAFLIQGLYGAAFSVPEASDVWGLTLMPSWFVYEKKFQLVARYQYAKSMREDGLQVQKRYESKAPLLTDSGFGDAYHAAYVGLNWYIYGSKLKVMTGVEYARMDGGSDGGDFDGWTWFNAIRIYF